LNPASLEARPAAWWTLGSLAAATLLIQFIVLLSRRPFTSAGPAVPDSFGGPQAIAQTLFTDFALPFEVASVLLLVAIIGAVALAQRQR